jgi:hypothetical protein
MTEQVTNRELLQELANRPLGEAAIEAGLETSMTISQRCQKTWLPCGRRSAATPEARAAKREMAERQIDIEDAVEAAGGRRGSVAK